MLGTAKRFVLCRFGLDETNDLMMTWNSYVESLEARLEKLDKLLTKVCFTLTLLPAKYSSTDTSSCSLVSISARKSINFLKKSMIRTLWHNKMKTKIKKSWSENWPNSISTQRRIGSSESRGKKNMQPFQTFVTSSPDMTFQWISSHSDCVGVEKPI